MDEMMIELLNIDCMEYMKTCEDKKFDLAIVDPPYGIGAFKDLKINNNRIQKVFQKSDNFNNKTPDEAYFDELFRISKKQIIWGANNFYGLPPTEYFIIWNKKQTVNNFASAEYAWTNCKKPAKVFDYGIHKHNQTTKIHPTQKPIALYRWLLDNYAKPGDLILDTHAGSFSSAVACKEKGFSGVFCELDPDYYKQGSDRVDKSSRQYELIEAREKPKDTTQGLF